MEIEIKCLVNDLCVLHNKHIVISEFIGVQEERLKHKWFPKYDELNSLRKRSKIIASQLEQTSACIWLLLPNSCIGESIANLVNELCRSHNEHIKVVRRIGLEKERLKHKIFFKDYSFLEYQKSRSKLISQRLDHVSQKIWDLF